LAGLFVLGMAGLVRMLGVTARPKHARMITLLALAVFVGTAMAHVEIKAF
jgi:hypothetical protein